RQRGSVHVPFFATPPSGIAIPRPAVNVAVRAARAAGQIILRYMNRLDSLEVVEKQRHDYVSEVDRLAEAEIIRELRRAYPRDAILGEESGMIGKSRTVWVIDPLDGTHNYLRGFLDRKSTRLNSSHVKISYAVFCLKKKK